ncbi:hypothetical protein PBI_INDLOVU_44 [Mycobacterium phage Indlovu]|nr:hypothetical protein PBI_INDLOVU_44 [Mycobacterium phage Indlovu]
MGSPFTSGPARSTTPASLQALATPAQLGFIAGLLAERDWRNETPSWVSRAAVINATWFIAGEAATDDRVAFGLDIELEDRADQALTFHQLMSYSFDSAISDERDPSVSKPLTKQGASKMIEWLKGLSLTAKVVAETEERNVAAAKASVASDRGAAFPSADVVPAGRYAIETEDGATNALAFYKVDRPTEGRWAGYVFVKLMVSDGEQRMSFAASKSIMAKIAEAGAEAASARYGHEIGECGVCGRTLTNDDSRARGIGPVCASKNGW